MNGQPLPECLEDFAFTLDGQSYQCFPVADNLGWFQLGLEYDRYHYSGIRVNFEKELVEIKDSHSITRYSTGQSITYTQWDEDSPDWYVAGPFEEWLREHVKIDIDRHLAWHFERLFRKSPIHENMDPYIALCEDFASLPKFEFNHWRNRALKFNVLAAIHRSRVSSSISESDQIIFEKFIEEVETGDLFERDKHYFLSLVLNLLPTIPDIIEAHHEQILDRVYDLSQANEEDYLSYADYWVRNLKSNTPKVRTSHHKRLLSICSTPQMCHVVASGLFEWPEEAGLYIEKGLSLLPENISLLMIAETFYLNHPKNNMLSKVRKRIEAMGCKSSGDDIQDAINRYTALCNDFQYFNPSTDTDVTTPELLALEAQLNQYWWNLLPDKVDLSRAVVETQLIQQQRFLSAGSASVFGWMRNQSRYQEVVDLMMPMLENLELCRLRHRSNPKGFEAFLNNGLSCFLDSQEEQHIEQAVVFMDALRSLNLDYVTYGPYYAFACIAARARQTQRAINNVAKAVELGAHIHNFKNDTDMRSIHHHPTFIEMYEASLVLDEQI